MAIGDVHTAAEFSRSALLVIDTQVDFVDGGSSPITGTTQVVPRIADLLTAFRVANRPIVHVIRLYQGEDVDLVRRTLIMAQSNVVSPGSKGSQIVGALHDSSRDAVELDHQILLRGQLQELGPNETALWKPRWSAFFRTPLDEHLRGQDISTVVIAGCNFPNCPRATAFDASERDYRALITTDATSGIKPGHLDEMTGIGVLSATTQQITQMLRTVATNPAGPPTRDRATSY